MRLGFAVVTALARQTMLDFTLEMLLKPRPGATTTDAGQDRR
jgi:hypothetical protein